MLGVYFIFLLAASYFLCVFGQTGIGCDQQLRETCDYSLLPQEYPVTVDELKDICRNIIEIGTCTLRVREGCSVDRNGTDKFRQILDYVNGVCREDSEIFQAISSNLECIASASEHGFQSCRYLDYSDATKELMMNTIREFVEKSQSENGEHESRCIDSLWSAYCPSIKNGISCGFEVGVAVKDILLNIHDSPWCTDKFIAEVTPMLDIVELAVIQDVVLKKMEEEKDEKSAEEVRRRRRFASPFQPFIDFQ